MTTTSCWQALVDEEERRAEERRLDEESRREEEARREARREADRQQAQERRRRQVACLDRVDTEYLPEIDRLEERWQELNFIPLDMSEEEAEARVAEFEAVDDELQALMDDYSDAVNECYENS